MSRDLSNKEMDAADERVWQNDQIVIKAHFAQQRANEREFARSKVMAARRAVDNANTNLSTAIEAKNKADADLAVAESKLRSLGDQ